MMKIKFAALFNLLTLILLAPLIIADRVGVIVTFPDGSVNGECLNADNGINGYDLIQKLSLQTLFAGPSSFGHMLCKVNGIGNEINGNFCSFSSNKFWRFAIGGDNSWKSMPVGFDGGNSCWNRDINSYDGHYCVKDRNVIGLDFVEFSENFPAFYSFDQICNPLKLNKIKVYVDGKKQNDADETGGDIIASPDSKISFVVEIENKYLFDDIKIEDIELEINLDSDDKDIEKKIKFRNLNINEENKKEIDITLPSVLQKEEYEIELKLIGRHSDIKQEINIDYSLEIEKNDNKRLLKTELENKESCINDFNNLFLELENPGNENEQASININSGDLKIDFSESFEINAGGLYKKVFRFRVPDLKPGDYKLSINLDYSENLKKDITLTIKDCNNLVKSDATEIINQKNIKIQKLSSKSQPINYQKSFLEIYSTIIMLGVFLSFLIVSLILIMVILNK